MPTPFGTFYIDNTTDTFDSSVYSSYFDRRQTMQAQTPVVHMPLSRYTQSRLSDMLALLETVDANLMQLPGGPLYPARVPQDRPVRELREIIEHIDSITYLDLSRWLENRIDVLILASRMMDFFDRALFRRLTQEVRASNFALVRFTDFSTHLPRSAVIDWGRSYLCHCRTLPPHDEEGRDINTRHYQLQAEHTRVASIPSGLSAIGWIFSVIMYKQNITRTGHEPKPTLVAAPPKFPYRPTGVVTY